MGILIALPVAAAIAILDKRKIEDFLLLAIGLIVLCILVSGMLGSTIPGVAAGIGLGIISFVYCVYVFCKERTRFRKSVLTSGFFGGLICIGITALMFIGTNDLGKDNDTFWAHAPQVINMYRYHDIGNTGRKTSTFMLLYTAPVYTSWCYFCNVLWPGYSDGINLWARQIFCIAGLMPLFSLIKPKDRKNTILMCVVVLAMGCFVDMAYDFMPDLPVGAAMVYGTLLTIRFFRSRVKYNDAWYLLGICIWIAFISVMKRAGGIYIYGMIGIASVYTADRVFHGEKGIPVMKKICPLLLMVASVLLSLCYTVYRYIYFEKNMFYMIMPAAGVIVFLFTSVLVLGFQKAFNEKRYIMLAAVTAFLLVAGGYLVRLAAMVFRTGAAENIMDMDEIFRLFMSTWFTGGERFQNGWVLSDFQFMAILFIVLFATRILAASGKLSYAGEHTDIDRTIGPVFVGYIVYMMFYCFICMAVQEGYIVDGRIGYTIRYYGPALMLTAAVTIYEMMHIRNVSRSKMLLGVAVLLFLVLPVNPLRFLSLERHTGWEKYNEMYEDAGVTLKEEDNVFCVGPDHCQYYVFPAYSEIDYGVKNAETDVEELKERFLSGYYDYLLLEEYAWDFPDKYQELFTGGKDSIEKWSIYDVLVDGDNVQFSKR